MINAGAPATRSSTRSNSGRIRPPGVFARGRGQAREALEVLALGLVETENAGECGQDLFGGLGRAPLFQADVVVDADAGQVRHFLAAQPLDSAATVGGYPDGLRVDPGTPGP